jgi:pimeloyl-ACP methyl ester carboxylesterase
MQNLDIVEDVPATFVGYLGWLSREGPFPEGTDAEAVLSRADPVPKIRAARRPLLVITGRNDPVYPSASAADLERAARSNPYARFVETPGGGHIGQLGLYPDWMATLMTRFFRAATGVPSRPEGSDRP